nr:LysM peptidoglycan-binding domain-containing protein [Arthrobacter sp. Soil764]
MGLTSCSYSEPSSAVVSTAAPASPASTAKSKPVLGGETQADSFGNVDFYTTVPGDTLANVAVTYKLSEAKVAEFNGIQPGASLTPGTKLRLIPAGPTTGAKGAATTDANGIPTSVVLEPEDTLSGITYRFNITEEQLAEANKVPFTYEKGNVYFIQAGHTIQLQKNPVDSRSGTGTAVNNSFGQTVFYTTVEGDSFDGIGYKFRVTTAQLLAYNPGLVENQLGAGSKLRLIAGDVKIEGAQGTYTADPEGIPLTYTTAPGDTERQISFRFGMPDLADLEAANRPSTGTGRVWYEFSDLPTGHLAPGQVISLSLARPINKPEA